MHRAKVCLALSGSAVALLAWLAWPATSEPPAAAIATPVANPVASQRGTQPDGAALTDDNSQLQLNPELRQLFDYYLASQGERDLAAIRRQLQLELQRSLSARLVQQALQLFDRYVAYRRSLGSIMVAASTDLSERLARAQALRTQFFSPAEIAGLFGSEDRYDNFTAKRLAIMASELAPEEKQRRVHELERGLPEDLRKAREEPVMHLRLSAAEAAIKQKGGGEQALYALRAGMAGQAAADRLAALDRQEANWQQRVTSFRQERQAILDNPQLNEAQQQQALADLQGQRFTSQEALRLQAFLPAN